MDDSAPWKTEETIVSLPRLVGFGGRHLSPRGFGGCHLSPRPRAPWKTEETIVALPRLVGFDGCHLSPFNASSKPPTGSQPRRSQTLTNSCRRSRRLAGLLDLLASISTTTFYANVIVPHGFRIALILWLSRSVALVQRGTDTTVYSAPIPKHLS